MRVCTKSVTLCEKGSYVEGDAIADVLGQQAAAETVAEEEEAVGAEETTVVGTDEVAAVGVTPAEAGKLPSVLHRCW